MTEDAHVCICGHDWLSHFPFILDICNGESGIPCECQEYSEIIEDEE